MGTPNLARLVYLAGDVHPVLPPKNLLKTIPQLDVIEAVAAYGVTGAAEELDIPIEQLMNLYTTGKKAGNGNEAEFRTLLGQIMLAEADLRRDEVSMSTYLTLVRDISNYLERDTAGLVAHEDVDLGEFSDNNEEVQQIPKFDTGFTPADLVTGGFYQGITTLIARPGHGKTSMLITMMEECRQLNVASSIWYFELEIPKAMMLYRIAPSATRTRFLKGKDRLICGQLSITDVEAEFKADPDEDRILIIDSPDVMAAGTGEMKRFAIEDIYTGLIRLKSQCKAILVSSWPRRKDREITLESGAEAWAKAWYSDIIIGATKLGRVGGGSNNVRLNVVKNRFGISDTDVTFQYNYADLSWVLPDSAVRESEGDW